MDYAQSVYQRWINESFIFQRRYKRLDSSLQESYITEKDASV
jgi:hypothetical protein